jgi:hypothetical protein
MWKEIHQNLARAIAERDHIHPESYRQLEQLVKLHGEAKIIAAVERIAREQQKAPR